MCAMMNLFYCLKALRGNLPACFEGRSEFEEFRDLPVERAEPPVALSAMNR
jgi:hypothetical protein